MDEKAIKKVYVVYKTHLDIGFTDMARNVLEHYVNDYIPRSLALARALNGEGAKKFIWTMGSYLIDYNLKYGSREQREALESAIQAGDVCWHALACTTHTELLDEGLFRYNLGIAKKLDARFGKQTIAAKMTDVPGHTIGIVDILADYGIEFLHIGVNGASMVPCVPRTFVWKHGEKSIIVQYAAEYGETGYVEGMDEVLEFVHSADNRGPQSGEEIEGEFARLRGRYPNAAVEAATLDDYARSLRRWKDALPVVEEEIGDTWIHGIASDPWKTGRYEELLRLKDRWLQEGTLGEDTPGYEEFLSNLMLIAEHTWGLDLKKYLMDFRNWRKEEFREARFRDVTTLALLTNRNAHMKESLKKEFQNYRNGESTGSYSYYESAHEEQRQYLNKALKGLPAALKKEARQAMAGMTPVLAEEAGEAVLPGRSIRICGWTVRVDGTGALARLSRDGKDWAEDGQIGCFSYETYNAMDCMENYYCYNRGFARNGCWAEADFSKPGLEAVEELEHRNYGFHVRSIRKQENRLLITLYAQEEPRVQYGCPEKAQILYTFSEEEIRIGLSWFGKDANRMPEALWFGFRLQTENPNRWQMTKLGTKVSPLNVVRGGNRLQHCAPLLCYEGADGKAEIESLHMPLVSAGGRGLYGDCRTLPRLEEGFYYNLWNNRWGTNFKMWCEDDCRFEFILRLKAYR